MMDKAGVDRSLVWLRPPYNKDIGPENRAVYEAHKKYPDRLLPLGWANPRLGKGAAEAAITQCFGYMRVRCEDCGESRVVAFSCKKRTFCPSCMGRRMVDTAARLTDEILPQVPVRQWVLSLPFEIRYRLAWDGDLV